MKTSTKFLAFGAACAACCALPFAVPLLAGSATLALGSAETWCVGGLAVAAIGAFVLTRRPSCASPAGSDSSCGCSENAAVTKLTGAADAAPIACTLSAGDFKTRTAGIRELAGRALRTARREPLRLHLTYAPEAAAEVRSLITAEQECCAFLQFEVRDDSNGINVTITAPQEARDAAGDLFPHFAPELAQESKLNLAPKEPVPS